MKACPKCYALNQDDAKACAECQSAMLAEHTAKSKELSNAAIAAASARRDYVAHAPSSADLTAQQWYSVCKFQPMIARKAAEVSRRPLARVSSDNPLDKTASATAIGFFLKRRGFPPPQREPGEEG